MSQALDSSARLPMQTRAYVAHPGDVTRHREVVLDVWRGNIGREAKLAGKFEWFYQTCPWGAPLLMLLRHEPSATWVGVAGAGRRRMLVDGREVRAGVLVDLAVRTSHRSLGPALTLQRAVMAAGRSQLDLLYGCPNPKAEPAFTRVGYQKLGESVRYARIIRHRGYLEGKIPSTAAQPLSWLLDVAAVLRAAIVGRRLPPLTARWHDAIDPRIDELWSRSEHGAAVIAPRDTALLRWRFDRAPAQKIRYLLLSDRGGSRLCAWFACEALGTTLHVRDFWSIDAARGIGRRFIEPLMRAARRDGHASVSVEYSGPPQRHLAWTRAGFVPRTRRPIYGKWLTPSLAREDIHLTPADEDE